MVKRILLAVSAASLLILAGCSSSPPANMGFEPHVSRSGLDPLLDSPLRTAITCKGAKLFTAGMKLGGFSFDCPDLDVTATMNEMRDAGWRVEKMNIGAQSTEDDDVGTPLTATFRKVY